MKELIKQMRKFEAEFLEKFEHVTEDDLQYTLKILQWEPEKRAAFVMAMKKRSEQKASIYGM